MHYVSLVNLSEVSSVKAMYMQQVNERYQNYQSCEHLPLSSVMSVQQ